MKLADILSNELVAIELLGIKNIHEKIKNDLKTFVAYCKEN
jgi:hypothetical protein